LAGIVMEMAERIGQDGFVRQQQAILGRIDSRPSLAAIAVPTLVLCGEADSLTPPALAAEMADAIPDASLVIVPQAGHLVPLEQPEVVNRAMIDWLCDSL